MNLGSLKIHSMRNVLKAYELWNNVKYLTRTKMLTSNLNDQHLKTKAFHSLKLCIELFYFLFYYINMDALHSFTEEKWIGEINIIKLE